jgi:Protein of unknown function (DUF4231)
MNEETGDTVAGRATHPLPWNAWTIKSGGMTERAKRPGGSIGFEAGASHRRRVNPISVNISDPRIAIQIDCSNTGFIVVTIETAQQLNQDQQDWMAHRSTCEALKHEKYLYLATSGQCRERRKENCIARGSH